MARLYDYYDDAHPPLQCFMRQSRWYKESGTFTPKGILLHDTAVNNDMLRRYVQPDDDAKDRQELLALLGKNPYGNDWNHGGKDEAKGVNAFIGRLDDGTVTTMQTGPWNKRPWGCGSGSGGRSLNDTHIQWEICEDAKKDKSYFGDVYEESVQLMAYLCKKYNIDPNGTIDYRGVKVPTILCHWDSYCLKPSCGSAHSDIYDWDAMYDYLGIPRKNVNINDPYNNPINLRIRADVTKAMKRGGKTGWVKENGKWYLYKDGQIVKNEWSKYKGQWFYLGSDGAMVTGWKIVDSIEYYFHKDGHLAQDEWIDGIFLDMSGRKYRNKGEWNSDKNGKWWEADGCYPRGRSVRIDNKDCKFDSLGYLIE